MRALYPTVTCLLLVAIQSINAQTGLPSIFGSNMVLQQNQPNRVWGWGQAGDDITVTIADQKNRLRLVTMESGKSLSTR